MKNADTPLSIALVYDDSLDGSEGVAQYVKTVGKWLNQRGHQVSYFAGETKATDWEGGKIYSLSKNVKVIFNGNRMFIPLWPARKEIDRVLETVKPDILHVQVPYSPLMAQPVINKFNGPTVGTFHIFPVNYLVRIGTKILKILYWRSLHHFFKIVSVSAAAQTFAKDAWAIDTDILPNVIEISQLSSKVKNQPMTIVYLGRLVPRKGCRQLIEAFSLVHKELPGSKLIIGGSGPQKDELQRLVNKLSLSKAVEFRGFVPEKEKADFLAAGSVACFPSLGGESFGIVLIEAMAAGSGCVTAGDNPGYASVISDDSLLFDPKNKARLADLLIKLLKNDKLRQTIGQHQRQLVKQFDIGSVGPRLEKLYLSAIANDAKKMHNQGNNE